MLQNIQTPWTNFRGMHADIYDTVNEVSLLDIAMEYHKLSI